MVLIAKILLFFLIIALAAALGAAVTFFGVIATSLLLGGSNMEGGLAMGAAGLAPAGALLGAVLGAWIAWNMIGRFSNRTIASAGYGFSALILLAIGGWFLMEELTDGDPYDPDREPVVLIEWRLPEAIRPDWVGGIFRHAMRSTHMNWPLTTHWDNPRSREEEGKTILRLRGTIRWRVTGRTFQLWRAPAHDDRITVDLGLPRDVRPTTDYGPWQEVESAPGHAFRTRIVAR